MRRSDLLSSSSPIGITSRDWYLRATMDARAFALWQKHGDAYAGMDEWGNAILWRPSPIPSVRARP